VLATIRNEWRVLRRDRALWWLCAAYSVLLAYGSAQSVLRVHARSEQVRAATASYESRWSALRAQADQPAVVWGDWRSPSLVGGPTGFAVTWMPVGSAMVLASAESARSATVRRISVYPVEEEPPLENPLGPAGGVLDLAFVVQWLMPLTLVAALHASVSGDRQLGTWRLIAATAHSPARIVAARLLVPAALIVAMTVGAGSVSMLLATPAHGVALQALFGWTVLIGVYAGFWALVAGAISSRTSTSASSLVALGLVWMAMTWVVPGLIDTAITASHPLPSRLDAHLAARETQRDLENKLPQMMEAVYAKHPDWRPSEAAVTEARRPVPGGPASRDSRRVYAPSLAATEAAKPFAQAVGERRHRMGEAVRRASVLSPPLALQTLADHLAGLSPMHLRGFDTHVADGEARWQAFFAPRIMQLRDMTRSDMDAVPAPGPAMVSAPLDALVWPAAGLIAALAIGAVAYQRGLVRLRS
jgi:ABC-2 type transport system permease protein